MRSISPLALLVFSVACGPPDGPPDSVLGEEAQLRVSSPRRLVHWQVNSDWPESPGFIHPAYTFKRAAQYDAVPDLFAVQECGRACACGSAQNHDPSTGECLQAPPEGTALWELQHATGLSYGSATSTWANSVFWRSRRFRRLDTLQWNWNAAPAACPTPSDRNGWEQMNVAVLLMDNRGTADPADDVRVVLASVHQGDMPGCTTALFQYFDREVHRRWGKPAFVFISGDLNMTSDTTSATAAARRQELSPGCWWQRLTVHRDASDACGSDFGAYVDPIYALHRGELCAQHTFPSSSSASADACTSPQSRIDFTFVRGTALDADAVLKASTDQGWFDANGNGRDDPGEHYAGHRAVRTVVSY